MRDKASRHLQNQCFCIIEKINLEKLLYWLISWCVLTWWLCMANLVLGQEQNVVVCVISSLSRSWDWFRILSGSFFMWLLLKRLNGVGWFDNKMDLVLRGRWFGVRFGSIGSNLPLASCVSYPVNNDIRSQPCWWVVSSHFDITWFPLSWAIRGHLVWGLTVLIFIMNLWYSDLSFVYGRVMFWWSILLISQPNCGQKNYRRSYPGQNIHLIIGLLLMLNYTTIVFDC